MKPAEISGFIKAERPYGQGALKKLGITMFHAWLWTDAAAWSMDAVFALTIRYARTFSAYALVEKSIGDMHRLEKLDATTRRAFEASLNKLFRDVSRDDTFTALYEPGQGATFFLNGTATGTAADILSRRFLDIWFNPRTTEPALREALVSGWNA